MILWITLKKSMSIWQKFYKVWVWLIVQFGKSLRNHSEYVLLDLVDNIQTDALKKVFRRIELLKKKGYQVRLKLMLVKMKSLPDTPELSEVSRPQVIQEVQLISL